MSVHDKPPKLKEIILQILLIAAICGGLTFAIVYCNGRAIRENNARLQSADKQTEIIEARVDHLRKQLNRVELEALSLQAELQNELSELNRQLREIRDRQLSLQVSVSPKQEGGKQ